MDEKTKLITMAVCGVVISAALIASFFAISFTQQAVAQGNTTAAAMRQVLVVAAMRQVLVNSREIIAY